MLPRYRVTSRFVLHAGYSCNERCQFCYYLEHLQQGTAKDFSTEENIRKIDLAWRWGKRSIDISGGEPTIRKDLPELINHCKSTGYETICIITNGIVASKPEYCATLQDAGLSEGLFSVHSHDPEIHDGLTRVTGSHAKILKAIENFGALGLGRRINTVVNGENYHYLDDFFRLVEPFDPYTVNLIVFNPSETAAHLDASASVRFADYTATGAAISKALDNWKHRFHCINVRFLPFCFLKDHPDCIRTQWQKLHEDQEWDPVLNVAFQKGWPAAGGATLAGMVTPGATPQYTPADLQTRCCKWLSACRMRLYYRQNDACRQCSLQAICTGVQRDVVKKLGFPAFAPFDLGQRITDPLHFVKDLPQIFQSLRESA